MPARRPVSVAAARRIRVKRVYRAAQVSDGKRILVDRFWPRGAAKDRARLFRWCKDIAPSNALRHRFYANPVQWREFSKRFQEELATCDDLLRELAGYEHGDVVKLLYASKDE